MPELAADAIAGALATRHPGCRLGHPVRVYERIGSTNEVALAEAAAGAAEGLLVLAEEQTAGRGRQQRSWWAPAGSSLLFSLLLRPPIPAGQAGQLTMCLGLGAVEAIEEVTGLHPALKWPNDLVLDGRKLGGMLAESRLAEMQLSYAVLGLGLNVNLDFAGQPGVPPDMVDTAISLQMALGRPVDRLALLVAILDHCATWYDGLLAGASPHAAWAARLDTLGRRVKVSLTYTRQGSGGAIEGSAVGVSPEGALLVRDDDGQVHTVWAGDVTALRPT
jgi:BirA family transcriptional regulator, biotin operon repressor / biotin---[acetyl-CoA-carboxylase] ligase